MSISSKITYSQLLHAWWSLWFSSDGCYEELGPRLCAAALHPRDGCRNAEGKEDGPGHEVALSEE